MRYRIELLESRCIGCGACAVACMDEKNIDPRRGGAPLCRPVTEERTEGGRLAFRYSVRGCRHCPDAPCLDACPVGCLRRDGETGLVLLDSADCVGCGACRKACPHGAPVVAADGTMRKCDGCVVRVRRGLLPACVKVCPMDALALVSYE